MSVEKSRLYLASYPRCINRNVTNNAPELNCLLTELTSFITKYYPATFLGPGSLPSGKRTNSYKSLFSLRPVLSFSLSGAFISMIDNDPASSEPQVTRELRH